MHRPPRMLTAVILAVTLVAAGCGDNENSDGAAPVKDEAVAAESSSTGR